MTPAAQRLQMILGSAAFDALEAYLSERDSRGSVEADTLAHRERCGDVGHLVPELPGKQCDGVAPVPRVVQRTVTDSIRTKDGTA